MERAQNIPAVSVVMITFGHEAFIRQAIEGVLMQECIFPLQLIVADDCSPDNTPGVMQELLNTHPRSGSIHYTRHAQNKGMMANFIWALGQAKGKYIALCEGDDYWTDPYKIQKQVDFLEENGDYSFVATDYQVFDEIKRAFTATAFSQKTKNKNAIITLENFLNPFIIGTLTVVFRAELINLKTITHKKHLKDLFLFALLLEKGYGLYLNEITGVYRIHSGGVWTGNADHINLYNNWKTLREMNRHFKGSQNAIKEAYTHEMTSFYLWMKKEKKFYAYLDVFVAYCFYKFKKLFFTKINKRFFP
jgi:glycosyltransferase involved in cell wall biosynthesis